jgi:hypothetical protein
MRYMHAAHTCVVYHGIVIFFFVYILSRYLARAYNTFERDKQDVGDGAIRHNKISWQVLHTVQNTACVLLLLATWFGINVFWMHFMSDILPIIFDWAFVSAGSPVEIIGEVKKQLENGSFFSWIIGHSCIWGRYVTEHRPWATYAYGRLNKFFNIVIPGDVGSVGYDVLHHMVCQINKCPDPVVVLEPEPKVVPEIQWAYYYYCLSVMFFCLCVHGYQRYKFLKTVHIVSALPAWMFCALSAGMFWVLYDLLWICNVVPSLSTWIR